MNSPKISMLCKGTEPLAILPVNGTYILGIYQGSLSPFDILLRYRQKEGNKWSRIRTPKHIHWAVDMLIKHYSEPHETDLLLTSLLQKWEETVPLESKEEQEKLLDPKTLLDEVDREATKYKKLAGKGEYSVKFLILIAKLLMVQEKTNRQDAYMFRNLLERLKEHRNIFEIVSTATLHG
ncbi:MAG: hypothetical protein HUK02_07245 [Bacteroidaceae bacterium]|nr:hypothetical protein [Bacteroidaceae bacterium]